MDVNKQLLESAKELVSIVEIHSEATESNFAWAELSDARQAIAAAEQAQQAEPAWLAELRKEVGYKKGASGYDSGVNADSVAKLLEMLDGKQQAEPVAWQLFKQALFVGMERGCVHYLMANAHGRRDGALKAHNHEHLCRHIIAAARGCDPDMVRRYHEDDYQAVHDGTQALTSYLDEVIGFPLDFRPDYDDLTPKFFDKFFELAMQALGVSPAAQPPAVAVAVPDEMESVHDTPFMSADTEPEIAYRDGWNACRDAMLDAMEQPK